MSQDHHFNNMPALVASWGFFVSSLAVHALPYVQIVALVFSIVASFYVIKKNRK